MIDVDWCDLWWLFQYAEMFDLPDDVINMLDEFSDAASVATEAGKDCQLTYNECPSETIMHIRDKIRNLMWNSNQSL